MTSHPTAEGVRRGAPPVVVTMAAIAAVIAASVVVWIAVLISGPSTASADALCDAMRARFGPGYPCISIPTNTFTPTAPAGPTTTGSNGQASTGGPQVGSNIGPGPGIGNGTPIVPVPGQAAPPAPQQPGAAQVPNRSVPTQTAPAVPGTQQSGPVPSVAPPSASRPPTAAPSSPSAAPTTGEDSSGTISSQTTKKSASPGPVGDGTDQQMLWLLTGAAAIVAGAATARPGNLRGRLSTAALANGYPSTTAALRSWLPGGGSERARIGNSQYVLINDPTSPREYVFHENVPPGGHMRVNPDGSVTVYNKDGQPVGQIAKPWAYDSLGRPQRTWYTVDNNGDLVQHVDPKPNALYPILADPPDPTIKQQQAAAAQGNSAHQGGTGRPLDKSPRATPPRPQTNPPPANRPDYGGDPHNQADTHSGLPPSQTASNSDAQEPQPAQPTDSGNGDDNLGLRDTLTAPIRPTPQATETPRSATQGAPPEPNQRLTYDDWLKNNFLSQNVSDGPNQFSDETGRTWRLDESAGSGDSRVWRDVDSPNSTITVVRNPDGSTTFMSNTGEVTRVGRDGEIIKSVRLDDGRAIAGSDISDAVVTFVPGVGLIRNGRLILSLARSGIVTRGGQETAKNGGDPSTVLLSGQANNGKGIIYQLEKDIGNGNVGSVRIMQPTRLYPNGYVRFYNEYGQPMNEFGKPGSKPDTHFRIEPDGTFKLPQGW